MADKKRSYAPTPRRRSSSVVRREFRRRVSGKPTSDRTAWSITRYAGRTLGRVISLTLIILLIAAFLIGGIGGGMLVGYILTAEPVATDHIRNTNETTRIVDANGSEIAILTGSQNINREYISLARVRDTYLIDAFMAIEDERYEDHIGIDPRRIGSAVLSMLVNGGTPTHGGSTITQQTVKLISGESQRSAQRKIQEWYNAVRLEQEKSKDEILELYLNLVPMGNSYVGIQAAAQAYFAKDAADLSLAECAFLAGVPNRPSTYNPLTETGRRNALRRMRIVLGKMHELEMISDEAYQDALNTELVFRQTPQEVSATQVNSYFVDYVIKQVQNDLMERRGYTEQMASIAVYNYGLRIETTMDQKVQSEIEKTFLDQSLFATDPAALADYPERPNGSIAIIDNLNNPGQIKGLVGGYGRKEGNLVLNRAVDSKRQPGSSIKPLVVYGPSLDTGRITPASIFTDMAMYLDPDNPTTPYPKNSYTGFRGNMTVYEALVRSVNTIAAHIYVNVIGNETALQYVDDVGITLDAMDVNASVALGGLTYGVSTLEMAGAYSTFANDGLFTEPYAYTRVLDIEGRILLENRPVFKQVYKPETAFVISHILEDVIKSPMGTARRLTEAAASEISFAGKTGTTNDNRDKWFCGYSPYYTAAVWYGYDNRLGPISVPSDDSQNAMRIWQDAMMRIHQGLEPLQFERPESVESKTICTVSGQIATEYCPTRRTEYFVPGVVMNPSDSCALHKPEPTPAPTPEASETDPAAGGGENIAPDQPAG